MVFCVELVKIITLRSYNPGQKVEEHLCRLGD